MKPGDLVHLVPDEDDEPDRYDGLVGLILAEEDVVMGLLYLGYTNEPAAAGKRNGTASEKTEWIK